MRQLAVYNYTNETCKVLYQVVRYADPKTFRQRRIVGYERIWTWSLGDVRRVLYRLPEVVEGIQAGRWIFLCEGEKDANNMADAGFCSTTACGGTGSANKFGKLYGDQLRDAWVCILPDNDDPSRGWATTIAKQLHGITDGVKIVNLWDGCIPDDKRDASDWLNLPADKIESMDKRVGAACWYVPPPEPVTEKPKRRYTYAGKDEAFQAQIKYAHAIPIDEIAEVKRKLTRCPMPDHEDVHPSCTVDDNLWWCPVCDIGGDTIRLVEKRDSCSFPVAVKTLCGGA